MYTETDKDGSKFWYNDQGQLHRQDGPAIEWLDGGTTWYQDGEIHRIDGPACEAENGDQWWYQHGKCHREDGPAIINYIINRKMWYYHGKLHRLDGPAIIWGDRKIWCIKGKEIKASSQHEFERYLKLKAFW